MSDPYRPDETEDGLAPAPRPGKAPALDRLDEGDDDRPGVARPVKGHKLTLVLLGLALVAVGAQIYAALLPWFVVSADVKATGGGGKIGTASVKATGRGEVTATTAAEDEKQGDWLGGWQKSHFREEELTGDARPHGAAVLGLGIGLAVLALASLALLVRRAPTGGVRALRDLSLMALLAGLVVSALWQLGWVIKVVVLNRKISSDLSETAVAMGTSVGFQSLPALGLLVGLGASLAAAICVNLALGNAVKRSWVFAAQVAGLAAGAAVVCLLVKPWEADALFGALLK